MYHSKLPGWSSEVEECPPCALQIIVFEQVPGTVIARFHSTSPSIPHFIAPIFIKDYRIVEFPFSRVIYYNRQKLQVLFLFREDMVLVEETVRCHCFGFLDINISSRLCLVENIQLILIEIE